jgi:sugar phosphate isomerase/epimerase
VLLHENPPVHLTYCTNIHPADGWPAVLANLQRIAPALKARLSPSAPFGLGLRLSAREARELRIGDRLAEFRSFLDREGLYVALINGFPYGPFHGARVKTNVYAPDWRDETRVRYTLDLIAILEQLLPEGLDGGVSTTPLSYKPWMPAPTSEDWETITRNVARVAAALVRVRQDAGRFIHLDVEPEPDCLIENTDEAIAFFEDWLRPIGGPELAASLGVTLDQALEHLRDHVQVCFDCCHFAVEYEDAAAALDRLGQAGLRIGRAQLSSALDVDLPGDATRAATVAAQLRPFAESTYLHQVVEKRGATLRRFPDLDVALGTTRSDHAPRQWRIHFHVPLFTHEYDGLRSTQDYVRTVLELVQRTHFTRHLEIETYTWDVLPAGLKMDVVDSIAREFEWVLRAFGTHLTP